MESITGPLIALSSTFSFDGSRSYKIFVVVSLPVWIVTVIFGSVYVGECPVQPLLQVYLIVAGCIGILKCVLNIIQWMSCTEPSEDGVCMDCMPFDFLLIFFLVIWTMIGNYWMQDAIKNQSFMESSPDYCNPALSWYTLVFAVICDILFVSKIVLYCCWGTYCDSCDCCNRLGYTSINQPQPNA
ncbi:transmembrane protein 272-like [Lineus longissimus]|uniref:transmembrane protein 272-like n=1 Tax=Lineus longissimus TaxID=88925 RepID=UPI002B4F23A3